MTVKQVPAGVRDDIKLLSSLCSHSSELRPTRAVRRCAAELADGSSFSLSFSAQRGEGSAEWCSHKASARHLHWQAYCCPNRSPASSDDPFMLESVYLRRPSFFFEGCETCPEVRLTPVWRRVWWSLTGRVCFGTARAVSFKDSIMLSVTVSVWLRIIRSWAPYSELERWDAEQVSEANKYALHLYSESGFVA